MSIPLNLKGKRFGRLVVLDRAENSKTGNTRWICKCDCGNDTIVSANHLRRGGVKSCGCYKKDLMSNRKNAHHKTNTKIYKVYAGIKSRCYNENNQDYSCYGGRGIKICNEWLSDFMNFYNWAMSNGYRENLTIERIDVNGNYEPKNCRWATRIEQSNNTRRNRFVIYNNEKHTIAEWSRILGIDYRKLENRIRKGLPLNRCFYKGNLSHNGVDYL